MSVCVFREKKKGSTVDPKCASAPQSECQKCGKKFCASHLTKHKTQNKH